MFRGVNPINLDGKGRMAIPARYRESIKDYCDGKMVATIDTNTRCLTLYPEPEWFEIEAKLDASTNSIRNLKEVVKEINGWEAQGVSSNGRSLWACFPRSCRN